MKTIAACLILSFAPIAVPMALVDGGASMTIATHDDLTGYTKVKITYKDGKTETVAIKPGGVNSPQGKGSFLILKLIDGTERSISTDVIREFHKS